jgi:hypothetical protein
LLHAVGFVLSSFASSTAVIVRDFLTRRTTDKSVSSTTPRCPSGANPLAPQRPCHAVIRLCFRTKSSSSVTSRTAFAMRGNVEGPSASSRVQNGHRAAKKYELVRTLTPVKSSTTGPGGSRWGADSGKCASPFPRPCKFGSRVTLRTWSSLITVISVSDGT